MKTTAASSRYFEMRALSLTLLGITLASADPLTFNTTPLGQKDHPIILRTYVPDPGLDPAVLLNHGEASKS
ncbi:MAG: hypothetical protein ACPGQF_10675, partial [Akkermansiaceae bacterium]